MEFIVNDLSIDGQFPDVSSFKGSIDRVMGIRQIIKNFGGELYCHKNMKQAQVTSVMTMPQAVNRLERNEKLALIEWISKQGPFWEDARKHSPDEYLECNSAIVTDSAVGEAAWCCLNQIERGLVSFVPSNWRFSPVSVDFVVSDSDRQSAEVENFWDATTIERFLQETPVQIESWEQLKTLTTARFSELIFSEDAFEPLKGIPFVKSAALRINALLDTLNKLKTCFDDNGNRTAEGHEIYQNFFTGKKGKGGRGALFTDSSQKEKDKFRSELTFKHFEDKSAELFCPWHGKVQTPQLRVHFSHPIRSDKPLYVVYIGDKITK